MSLRSAWANVAAGAALTAWLVVVAVPLGVLAVEATIGEQTGHTSADVGGALIRSLILSALIAIISVGLGWWPGTLAAQMQSGRDVLLLALLMPLVLPRYVLLYAWTLLLDPTTPLGRFLAADPGIARFVGQASACGVLGCWFWPLAALILAQGRRSIDRRIMDSAALDANASQIRRYITVPLLRRYVLLAAAVCFVLSLSEFATFHLAGVRTIGTELAVLYELTGSEAAVARAAWPVLLIALAVAILAAGGYWSHRTAPIQRNDRRGIRPVAAIITAGLLGLSLGAPTILLVAHLRDAHPFVQFLQLHWDELVWSLLIAVVAAALAHLVAGAALLLEDADQRKPSRASAIGKLRAATAALVRVTIFAAMLLPASLLAASLLKTLSLCRAPGALRQSWLMVSIGQASRFAGIALILLLATRRADRRRLVEMAAIDGASRFRRWLYVQLPLAWPVYLGSGLLVVMFGFTELSATMILLGPGVPNFAQRLLNQMHYARDQHVIASCLVLIGVFCVLAAGVVLLLRVGRLRRLTALTAATLLAFVAAGCKPSGGADGEPRVLLTFGKAGLGPGEFNYPRAIDIAVDGTLCVIDKSGRIQRFTREGRWLGATSMPKIEAGKPTGLSFSPEGNLYIADTHYHRVLVLSPEGQRVDEFGEYGTEGGQFFYPTDVAFAPDGRIFVSEYGGNDRVSVFSAGRGFLLSFGSQGHQAGQFSRPAALCVDAVGRCLYVADACNHRIAVYDLDGNLIEYFGALGRQAGQLRYPYDLAMLDDRTLVVCEFGNNRIQLFDPHGQSLGVFGRAGRNIGELAYPWGAAVDQRRRAFIVDAGNNRIQVWQL